MFSGIRGLIKKIKTMKDNKPMKENRLLKLSHDQIDLILGALLIAEKAHEKIFRELVQHHDLMKDYDDAPARKYFNVARKIGEIELGIRNGDYDE